MLALFLRLKVAADVPIGQFHPAKAPLNYLDPHMVDKHGFLYGVRQSSGALAFCADAELAAPITPSHNSKAPEDWRTP